MQKLLITLISFISLTATGQNQKTYELNHHQSVINWKGSYAFAFSEHEGTVNFKEGQLFTNNDNISGGTFIIDMNSISNEEHLKKIGPVTHLKDTDFFDVNKFPEAELTITLVEYFTNENIHKISADLTIKEITKPIIFWANVDSVKKVLETKFMIDRTDWGITYNNRLKNEAISDAIEFHINLQF